MIPARLLGPAEAELRTAARWYEDQRPGLGVEFAGAVDAVLARIGETPEQFPVWISNRRFHRAVLARFPYALFFYVLAEEPVVVAIAHTRRRPGYRLSRVMG